MQCLRQYRVLLHNHRDKNKQYLGLTFTVCSISRVALFAGTIEITISIVTIGIEMAIVRACITFVDI